MKRIKNGWKSLYLDQVAFYTEFILDMYEMDLMTALLDRVMSKRDLNEMLDSVRSLRNSLMHIAFE